MYIYVDSHGHWARDVHYKNTKEWAERMGVTTSAAKRIATADNGVDAGKLNPTPWGDQSYHFDTLPGPGDSRFVNFSLNYAEALWECNWVHGGNDNKKTSADYLGTGLHALQDWYAHGEHNSVDRMGLNHNDEIRRIHNFQSPQTNLLSTHGHPSKYPDDVRLDAINGDQYHRPAGSALTVVQASTDRYDYAYYKTGTVRFSHTERTTLITLIYFRSTMRPIARPNCRCWEYFGL